MIVARYTKNRPVDDGELISYTDQAEELRQQLGGLVERLQHHLLKDMPGEHTLIAGAKAFSSLAEESSGICRMLLARLTIQQQRRGSHVP